MEPKTILISDPKRLLEDERERAFFGISSTELYYRVQAECESIIKEMLIQTMRKDIAKQCGSEEKAQKVEEKLLRYLMKCLGESTGTLQEEIQKLIKIPDNVVLESEEISCENCTDANVKKLQCEVDALEKEYVEQMVQIKKQELELKIIEKLKINASQVDNFFKIQKTFKNDEVPVKKDILKSIEQDIQEKYLPFSREQLSEVKIK